MITDHLPAPGPDYWAWRCLVCGEPVADHRWRDPSVGALVLCLMLVVVVVLLVVGVLS